MISHARLAVNSLPPSALQFVRFCTVGVSSLALDLGTYNIFLRAGFSPALALSVAFVVGVTNSYVWNSRWTFKDRRRDARKQIPLFFATNFVGFLLNLGITTAVLVAGVHYHWSGANFTPAETVSMVLFRSANQANGFSLLALNAAKLCAAVAVTLWNFGASKFITFK